MPETLVALEGGLDLRSAAISAPKGTLSNCYNFEKDQGPGYVRRLGWCRYDGTISGPEIDNGVVIQYDPRGVGTFLYAEQVQITDTGQPTVNAIVIGQDPVAGYLLLAYPMARFTDWGDIGAYQSSTTIVGLASGATIPSIIGTPRLMNDASITVAEYDFLKRIVQAAHSAAIKPVPGRAESPVDAVFTYKDKSYAIHDCVVATFTNGSDGGVQIPLEGHILDSFGDQATVLSITQTGGDWGARTATGTMVLYDLSPNFAPSTGAVFSLRNPVTGAVLVSAALEWGNTKPNFASPNATRALLYETYEQYVKTYPFNSDYGSKAIAPLPPIYIPSPPTWTRPRLTRELPYAMNGSGVGFGPIGAATYSTYEYTRQGLTTNLAALSPVTTEVLFPNDVGTLPSPGGSWVNVNNIKAQDGNTATYPATTSAAALTHYLIASNFNFSDIPDASTILGVRVRVRASCTNSGDRYLDYSVNLVSSAFPTGMSAQDKGRRAPLTTSLADYTYGSTNDLWGEQLTTTVLKNASFGVAVRFQKKGPLTSEVAVDCISIEVSYVPTTRRVYIRDQTVSGAPGIDIPANVVHYCLTSGDFTTQTAQGVLTVWMGDSEEAGTAAGKPRRVAAGNEIRTAPSDPATNAPGGQLLAYVAAEDYPVTFPPSAALDAESSRYEVIDANFWDIPDGRAAYLVNGAEFASMWDGTYLVRIRGGMPDADDKPRHVAQHGAPTPYLYLGYKSGAVVNTGAGHPLSTLGAIGAGVLNFGEPITGMLTLNGSTLGIWTDRATRGIQGNNPSNATPTVISPAINCIEYTLVNLVGEAVWTSYRGVETVRTVNAYGDFETLPLSAAAQGWLQGRVQVDQTIGSRPSRAVYAIGVRNKRQYRLYFEDGYVFTLTLFDAGDLPVPTVQRIARPNALGLPSGSNDEPLNAGVIRHVFNGTRSDGKEVILAAFESQNPSAVPAANGSNLLGPYFPYAVRLDCGYSDDFTLSMPAFIELNAIYAGYPTQGQQWHSGTLFMGCYGGTQAQVYSKLDYDGPIMDSAGLSQTRPETLTDVRVQTLTLPTIETRAYIPVPQRALIFDVAGEGRALKLRFDLTQVPARNPVLMPMRLTHVSLTTSPQKLDRS